MSPTIELAPLSPHGTDVLNQFEDQSGSHPYAADSRGTRSYEYAADRVPATVSRLLTEIDPSWSEHIDLTLSDGGWELPAD